MTTYAEAVAKVAEIDAAISRCLTAQSYSIAGRSKQSASLKDLTEQRAYWSVLADRLNTASGEGGSVRYPVFGSTR